MRPSTQQEKGEAGERKASGTFARSLPELALERVSDGVVALDRDGRYTYLNEQAARMIGRPVAQILGTELWALYPEPTAQPFLQACRRALASGQPTHVENYYEPWKRWFESRIYPSSNGFSVFFQDISERKRSEALLVGQARVLELVASGASLDEVLTALLLFLEAQCNDMLCTILLLDDDGKHLRHGAAPSLPERFTRPMDGAPIGPRAGSCGTAAFLGEPVITEDIATDPAWEDWRPLALPLGLRACWSTPIFDDRRVLLGTFAMYSRVPSTPLARDRELVELATHVAAIAITHERGQDALRRSESRYRRLVDSNVIGVVISDRRGVIVEANDEFLRIVGHARTELESGQLRWETLTAPEYRAIDAEIEARLAESGVCPAREKECLHARGHRIWIRLNAALLEGREHDSICLVEDMSERIEQERLRMKNRELEESNRAAQEATRLKSEFLANMSHELRTPLNAVIGFSEFVLDGTPGPLNRKQSECLEHVLTSGQHLLRLIDDILDLTKVEAGKVEISPSEFRLRDLLEEVCSVARVLADEKQIAVELRCDPELELVTLDPQKVRQVLYNLLGNAVKFTGEGGCIEVSSRAIEPDQLEIGVRDNGIGISAEDLPKLFQEFHQLDSGTTRQHEGSGVGLVLAKRLAESLHGQIAVASTPGAGSLFCLVLPRTFGARAVEPSGAI